MRTGGGAGPTPMCDITQLALDAVHSFISLVGNAGMHLDPYKFLSVQPPFSACQNRSTQDTRERNVEAVER